jgi:hypothetical protein
VTNWRSEDEPLPLPGGEWKEGPPYKYTFRNYLRARWFYLKRWLRAKGS